MRADISGMRLRNPSGCLASAAIALCLPAAAHAHSSAKPVAKHGRGTHGACVRASARRKRHGPIRSSGRRVAKPAAADGAALTVTIPPPAGTIYYVSPTGSDAASGTSPAEAWQTVEQVDRASLVAGDEVLFQGGATFADDALMPDWGEGASGTSTAPISFGSYGQGQARITQGVWFSSGENLAFQNLILGGESGIAGAGFQGDGDGITILHTTIEHAALGINAEGEDWTIADSTINETGDSGMLLGYTADAPGDPPGGSDFVVTGNTISNTGLNPADTYGTHGIYDKVANSTISDNTISHFTDDGISARYRNSTISDNRISYGDVGLAWFQYDTTAGVSRWTDNTISHMNSAGIYVCGVREGCLQPLESFQISGSSITDYGAMEMNLQTTSGTYSVSQPQLPAPTSAASRAAGTQSRQRANGVATPARPRSHRARGCSPSRRSRLRVAEARRGQDDHRAERQST
jgi:parallel beta-helix repeat protein